MAMSIIHRATGIALSIGLLLLVYWLLAAAAGSEAYDEARALVASPIGKSALAGWTVSLFYHLGNGIRHLFWDAGVGFEMKTAYRSGWAVLVFTVAASAITWYMGLSA